MWPFSNNKGVKDLSEKTEKSFELVKQDIETVGRWLKHLDSKDKELFDVVYLIREEIATIREEIEGLREGLDLQQEEEKHKQVFKKLPVLSKQTTDEDVQEIVQTVVQTDNIYGVLNKLSGNERVLVLTLLNSDLKLSYEDLALLLGKERSTIRGQINAIKQKSEGLIREISEKNGKKRVYIPEEIKEKMQKYAKVRGGSSKKEVKRTQKE